MSFNKFFIFSLVLTATAGVKVNRELRNGGKGKGKGKSSSPSFPAGFRDLLALVKGDMCYINESVQMCLAEEEIPTMIYDKEGDRGYTQYCCDVEIDADTLLEAGCEAEILGKRVNGPGRRLGIAGPCDTGLGIAVMVDDQTICCPYVEPPEEPEPTGKSGKGKSSS